MDIRNPNRETKAMNPIYLITLFINNLTLFDVYIVPLSYTQIVKGDNMKKEKVYNIMCTSSTCSHYGSKHPSKCTIFDDRNNCLKSIREA